MSACSHNHQHGHGECADAANGASFEDAMKADPGIDEMEPCCRREIEQRKKAGRMKAALDKVDPTSIAMHRRRDVVGAIDESDLPVVEGGDYPALHRAREAAAASFAKNGEQKEEEPTAEAAADSDSDDSWADEDENDDPELRRMAAARMEEVRRAMEMRARLQAHGYGAAQQLHWRDLDAAIDAPGCVVCHFYNPASEASPQLDLLLERMAGEFCGTRFVRCRAPTGIGGFGSSSGEASDFARRHGAETIAAGADILSCYRNGERVASVDVKRDFILEGDVLEAAAAEQWLRQSGVLEATAPPLAELEKCAGLLRAAGDDSDEEDVEYYDCGLANCRRTFAHDHIATNVPAALQHRAY